MPLFRRSKKIKRIITEKLKDKRDELARNLNAEVKGKISFFNRRTTALASTLFAAALAKSILKIKSPTGSVIALNGPWGLARAVH